MAYTTKRDGRRYIIYDVKGIAVGTARRCKHPAGFVVSLPGIYWVRLNDSKDKWTLKPNKYYGATATRVRLLREVPALAEYAINTCKE